MAHTRERYSGRLLVIDDSVTFCRQFQQLLERLGYRVDVAHDPRKGLQFVLAEPVDAVLLEKHLPGMDGYALCRLLKKYPQTSGLPVVLLSNDDALSSRVEGLRAGADEYLSKRISPEELDGRLQSLLRAQRLRGQIEDQHQQLMAVLEGLSDGVILVDRDGVAQLANRAALSLLRLDQDILRLRSMRQILSTLRFPQALADRLLATAEPFTDEIEVEIDGQPRLLAVRCARVTRAAGQGLLTVLVLQDVTERRETERLKADFHSMIAHDLRSPLSVIQGYLSLLLKEKAGALTPHQEEFLCSVQEKVWDVSRLLDDFLDMSKLDAGCIVLDRRPTDLRMLLCASLHDVALLARDRGLTTHLRIAPPLDGAQVVCDGSRIKQVLQNLLSNAVKYNRLHGRIDVRARLEGNELLVEVQDEGIGVPPEKHQEIFERYVRLKEGPDAPEGLGLGLLIVRKIVEAHGGRSGVRSAAGEGATFWFTLPAELPACEVPLEPQLTG